MFTFLRLFLFLYAAKGIHGLIIPEEVPSLLSLVYSNIPPIKKGTDSRLGWGFRLGDHADFQIIVELGPQTNTRPLGNEKDKNVENKRYVPNTLRNALWAQNQLLKEKQKEQISDTQGGQWLKSWSTMMNSQDREPIPIEGTGEIDASLVIPHELEELYGKPNTQRIFVQNVKTEGVRTETTTGKVITTTNAKDALDNVDLE